MKLISLIREKKQQNARQRIINKLLKNKHYRPESDTVKLAQRIIDYINSGSFVHY